MKIEDVIQSKKIDDEYQRLYINLSYTFNWVDEQVAKFFKKNNLTNHQYNILRILRGSLGKPLPAFEIQNRMVTRNSNVTRIIEKLLLKELVTKKFNDNNRRQVEVAISEKGLALLNKLDGEIERLHNHIFHLISPREAAEINGLLDKIRG